jgi:hypothetical protein
MCRSNGGIATAAAAEVAKMIEATPDEAVA